MNWWLNMCVGMFTVVNPRDSSRPGRLRRLNRFNGISKGLLQPLGCRFVLVTASQGKVMILRRDRISKFKPLRLNHSPHETFKQAMKKIHRKRFTFQPQASSKWAFWLIQWPFHALLRCGVEPYICQACLAQRLHSLHLVSADCVTRHSFTFQKPR